MHCCSTYLAGSFFWGLNARCKVADGSPKKTPRRLSVVVGGYKTTTTNTHRYMPKVAGAKLLDFLAMVILSSAKEANVPLNQAWCRLLIVDR